ncbi:MAG: hypothetical protein WCD18_04765 [Thermosynechococcaceae cyanobacterium]
MKIHFLLYISIMVLVTSYSASSIAEGLHSQDNINYISQNKPETPHPSNQNSKDDGNQDFVRWLLNNKEWVFSGVGVAVLGFLFFRNRQQANQTTMSTTIHGDGIVAGRDINGSPLSRRQVNDNYPEKIFPVIDLSKPINTQIQLFATDKVRITYEEGLQEVKFGGNWQKFNQEKEYMVIGIPGTPVIPNFKGKGQLKVEISYTADRDKPRDIRR